jgi:hypothetical protein
MPIGVVAGALHTINVFDCVGGLQETETASPITEWLNVNETCLY